MSWWRCRAHRSRRRAPCWMSPPCGSERRQHAVDVFGRRGLVTRHGDVVLVDEPDVDAARLGLVANLRGPARHARQHRVEEPLVDHVDALPRKVRPPGCARGRAPGGRCRSARRRRDSWRTSRRSPPAEPARCRCCWWPCHGECAVRGSAGTAGRPVSRRLSTDTPTSRPGSCRAWLVCTAR